MQGRSVVDRLDDLLASPDVDAIDIATSPAAHVGLIRRAAQAGKMVHCQEPMARNFHECRAILWACQESGVRLMINENFRWRGRYRAAEAVPDQGTLGSLFHLRMTFRRGTWRRSTATQGRRFNLRAVNHFSAFSWTILTLR
jgi:predicted dehydrogenase